MNVILCYMYVCCVLKSCLYVSDLCSIDGFLHKWTYQTGADWKESNLHERDKFADLDCKHRILCNTNFG